MSRCARQSQPRPTVQAARHGRGIGRQDDRDYRRAAVLRDHAGDHRPNRSLSPSGAAAAPSPRSQACSDPSGASPLRSMRLSGAHHSTLVNGGDPDLSEPRLPQPWRSNGSWVTRAFKRHRYRFPQRRRGVAGPALVLTTEHAGRGRSFRVVPISDLNKAATSHKRIEVAAREAFGLARP